jgi:hypothetical protein
MLNATAPAAAADESMANASSTAGFPPGCHCARSRTARKAKAMAASAYDQTLGSAYQMGIKEIPAERSTGKRSKSSPTYDTPA